MKRMCNYWSIFGCICGLSLVGCGADEQETQEQQPTPLLVENAGFELSLESFNPWVGWGDLGEVFQVPTYAIHTTSEGFRAFGAVRDGSRLTGGIYQRLDGAVVGVRYLLTVDLMHFTTGDGEVFSRIGVDYTGGVDPHSPDIHWSTPESDQGEWYSVSIAFEAKSPQVTVFLSYKQGGVSAAGFVINYFDNVRVEPILPEEE